MAKVDIQRIAFRLVVGDKKNGAGPLRGANLERAAVLELNRRVLLVQTIGTAICDLDNGVFFFPSQRERIPDSVDSLIPTDTD